jgi:ribulose-5-phosphate 4-epimerase/fuculose-1-phosphate aldolase
LRSVYLGPSNEPDINPEFLDLVRSSAEELTKHVNAINPNRFLGNASTRCSYGFPAVRGDVDRDRIFVTRRNIDKQYINAENFVEVTNNEKQVEYWGEHKPSVDTPIQVRLFNHYPRINYMIHGHSYLDGVSMTTNVIPCGAIEEVDDIIKLFPDTKVRDFACNLRGHGFIIAGSTVNRLRNYTNYKSRPFPETQYRFDR